MASSGRECSSAASRRMVASNKPEVLFIVFNPDYPLGRHSGAGRNPAIKKAPQSGQNNGVVPLAWEFVNQLDTGLRRYDAVFSKDYLGSTCSPSFTHWREWRSFVLRNHFGLRR